MTDGAGTASRPPIGWSVDGAVARITIGGDGHLGAPEGESLFRVLTETDLDLVRCVVVSGGTAGFARGTAAGDPGAAHWVSRALDALQGLSLPTVAAIDGEASGLGCELAMACDLRVAGRRASLRLPYVLEGLVPIGGATQRLPRLVGVGRAMDMLLTGRAVDADEAYRWGLVDRVVDDGQVGREAGALAEALAELAPVALAYAKEAVLRGSELSWDAGMRLEMDLSLLLHTTDDRRRGIEAFLHRVPPRFEGR